MTISSTTSRMEYAGNGVTTVFPYTFKILDKSHIAVYQSVGGVESLLVVDTDYTVSGIGSAGGGNVTMLVAPANGDGLVFLRSVPLLQETDIKNQSTFYPEVHEAVFDRMVMVQQQQAEELARAVKILPTSGDAPEDYLNIAAASAAAAAASEAAAGTSEANAATSEAEAAASAAAAVATPVAAPTHAATSKATPVDADELPLADSAASFALKKLTWANLKAVVKAALEAAGMTFTGPLVAPSYNGGGFLGRNRLINGNFSINQRGVSGSVVLAAGAYGHDRWKAGAGGCTYTFATVENVTAITISAGTLMQVIEGMNLQSGTHILSWSGTAQGRVDTGAYGTSGNVTGTAVGGTNQTIEFGTGTLSLVQYEKGTIATPFEHLQYSDEELLCKRYFTKVFAPFCGVASGSSNYAGDIQLPVTMRVAPTIAQSTTVTIANGSAAYTQTALSLSGVISTTTAVQVNLGNFGGALVANAVYVLSGLSDHLNADAEI